MERDIKPTYDELESYVENLQKQLADAQVTIEALQARVRELEEWVQDQSTANLETMRHTDEMQSRALEAEQQLTQRTAELQTARCDAVRAFVRGEDKMCLVCGAKEPCELKNDPNSPCTFEPTPMELLKALHQRTAELERVRGERDEYAHKTKMLCLQNGPLMIENHDMKKLIAALPKVEGAVVVSNGYVKDSTRCHALFGADEDAALYAALLQHRQGMEG